MECPKCPFMGGNDCMAENCALWVSERVVSSDFKAAGNKWYDRETVKPSHCALNNEKAQTETFMRVVSEGEAEEEEEKSDLDPAGSAFNTVRKVELKNTVYNV